MSAYSAAILGTSGLLSYWRMSETSTQMNDYAGSYPLTFRTGTISTGQAGAIANDANTAVSFSSNGYISNTSTTGLPSGNAARSVEVWVKTTQTGQGDTFGYGNGQTHQAFGMNVVTSGGLTSASVFTWADDLIVTGLTVRDGNWHHQVGTYDGNVTLKLYWDGSNVGTLTLSAQLNTVLTFGVAVGKFFGGTSNYLSGSVDEEALYDRVLTADEVLYHYNLGKGVIANDSRSKPRRMLQAVKRAATW